MGELWHVSLAQDNGASRLQAFDNNVVLSRDVVLVDDRSGRGLDALAL